MKYLPLMAIILCSCAPRDPLPPGFETVQMTDGFYLRRDGVFLTNSRCANKAEAIGRAYLMASAPSDPSHIKLDAVLEQGFATNSIFTNGATHELIHRFVWVSFTVQGFPFKGLLSDQVVADQVPTNAFKLESSSPK